MDMLLIPVCFSLAALFLLAQRRGRQNLAVTLKGLASLCFVLLGLSHLGASGTARLIVTGLALGCIADVVLGLRALSHKRRMLFFVAGSVIFLCGHLAYLTAIWPGVDSKPLCLGLGLVCAALLIALLFRHLSAKKQLKIFGGVYFSVLVLLTVSALVNAAAAPGGFAILFAAGTLLFLASDVILNLYSFGPKLPYGYRILYSGLYYAAQVLIAESILFL